MRAPRLSITVAHLPGHRETYLYDLLARLSLEIAKRGYEDVVALRVCNDPEPDGPRHAWRTSYAAWQMHRLLGADHALCLQDDAEVCRNFIAAVLLTTRIAKGVPVSYYTMHRMHVAAADRIGLPWWQHAPRGSGLALHLPRQHVGRFIDWIDTVEPDPAWKNHDDYRFTAYLKTIPGQKVWSTVPSLVEHRLPSASLVGNNNRTRVAARYIGDGDPLSINWKRTPGGAHG